MASPNVNPDAPENIYKWIERKPLTEAVLWTHREKFYLIGSIMTFGQEWKSVTQVLKNVGEPFRPIDWYSATNCERQFKTILNSQTNEVKSLEYSKMMKHVYDVLIEAFIQDLKKTHDSYVVKYTSLNGTMNRLRQGNLSRNEVNSLYSQTKRNEIESKQYMEQLRTRQIASLASQNSSSGSSEEPIKWNAPPAPLLTSLLRSGNTIPNHRNNNTATSPQLQSPGGTSRTRSGKLLSPSIVRSTQGTPTLSKLLEAPANPYISSPPQSSQKNKLSEVFVTDQFNEKNSKKENSQSPVSNRVQVDNLTGPFNQFNKCEFTKRQTSISPFIFNGSNASSGIVNLLSDSENEGDNTNVTQNIFSKNVFQFGEKKNVDNSKRNELRATRSQTKAEGSFKLLSDNTFTCEKKEQETLQQQSEGSQMTISNIVDNDVIDIDQIEVEPLSSVHDEVIISSKVTRSSSIKNIDVKIPSENSLSNKTNSKETHNQTLEEISANFVLNSSVKSDITDNKNVMVGHSHIDSTNVTGSRVPIDSSVGKDSIILRKDGRCFPSPNNTIKSFDKKVIIQKKCVDNKKDKSILSFANEPMVVLNKIKKPFDIKLLPEFKDKTEDIQIVNYDPKKSGRLQDNTQDTIHLLDSECTFSDEVIIIDDDTCISLDDGQKESFKTESEIMSLKATKDIDKSNIPSNSKATNLQQDKIKNSGDKSFWKVSGKPQHLANMSTKQIVNQDAMSKAETQNNSWETNNHLIKVLDIDVDQSTSLSKFYNGVEEIVEMHSLDNEELNPFECGFSRSNVTKQFKNTNTLDGGESSVSECDSTVGAFDTFAQITSVTQKAASRDIKSVTGEIKTPKQDRNYSILNKGFVCTEKNDEQGSGNSATGIPILQGVITDVMKKINSDKVADHNKLFDSNPILIGEIVEISSDEEEIVSNNLKVVDKNIIQEHDREVNINKLNEFKLLTTKNLRTTDKDVDHETDIISSNIIANNVPYEINKSHKNDNKYNDYNILMKCITKKPENLQSKNEKELYEVNNKIAEAKLISNNEILKKRKDSVEYRKELNIKSQVDNKKCNQNELTKEIGEHPSTNIEERQHNLSKTKNIEVQTVEETLSNKFKAAIDQRLKQNENKKSEALGMIQLKDTEIKTAREDKSIRVENKQLKKSRDLQVTKISEFENQKVKNVEMQRLADEVLYTKYDAALLGDKKAEINLPRVVEIQKTKEGGILQSKLTAGIQDQRLEGIKLITLTDPPGIQIVNEENIKETYDTKLTRIDETNKPKEVEEKKNTDIKMNKEINETEFERSKDSNEEIKNKNKETETNKQQGSQELTLEEESKKSKKLEPPMVGSKKVIVKENTKQLELKISKIKELEQPNIAGNENKHIKEAQIITRTRGLKVDESKVEKFKESYNLQNIPIKEGIVLLESYVPLVNDCLLINDGNKCNLNSHIKLINSHTCDRNLNDSASEVSSKSRTRSLLKQGKIVKTKCSSSLKSVDQSDLCTIPKASLGTKTRISTTLNLESPTTSSNSQHKISLSQTDSPSRISENHPKRLTSVDILSSNCIIPSKEKDENTNYTPVKLSEVNAAIVEHFPQTTTENFDTSCHKKRGRKRRTDMQNEEFHQSNNEQVFGEYDVSSDINTLSANAIEPVTKKTKNSVESFDSNIFVERTIENIKTVFENKCEGNKTLLSIEKQIKETPLEYLEIIKDYDSPVMLDEIKNKIVSGKVSKLSDLQVNLFRMAVNLNMIQDSNTTVIDDDSSNTVINQFVDIKQVFQCRVYEDNSVIDSDDSDDSEDEQLELNDPSYPALEDDILIISTLSDCEFEDDFDFDLTQLFSEEESEDDSDNDSFSSYDEDSELILDL